MKKPHLATLEPKVSSPWERLEDFVREHVQRRRPNEIFMFRQNRQGHGRTGRAC